MEIENVAIVMELERERINRIDKEKDCNYQTDLVY